ncbi:hypothetical protein BDZ91DRAFT_730280 [Kalaharituber pfeilii]|nr:hypothetical protein BDZ91DRAFT_730280 [Kalaharituber pfeilii]
MQIFTLSLLTAFAFIPATFATGACPPKPPPKPPACNGDIVCCSVGVVGNVAHYCSDRPSTVPCGSMKTVCCAKDAKQAITPRGYTYSGDCKEI